MTVNQIAEKLNLSVLSGKNGLENAVSGVYVGDLLSDVMGNATEGQIWITLQTHKNIMAIASLKDLAAVVLVKNLSPNDDTYSASNQEAVPILSTSLSTFEISGMLYNLLNNNAVR